MKNKSWLQMAIAKRVLTSLSTFHTFLYRCSGGKLGGRMFGAPVCLLTTTGRKSGQPRTLPLLYLRDGEKAVLVASKGGWPTHPLWYQNLLANPEVELQIGAQKHKMRAETASDAQRDVYWPQLTQMYKPYQSYQDSTDRKIPVVVLHLV
jgi:deazaflavin-dependent oxidoreductase (nitroreductase family)